MAAGGGAIRSQASGGSPFGGIILRLLVGLSEHFGFIGTKARRHTYFANDLYKSWWIFLTLRISLLLFALDDE